MRRVKDRERERERCGSEWVRERGRLLEREKDEESMRIGKEKQMCQNCMPTMNVNTLCIVHINTDEK